VKTKEKFSISLSRDALERLREAAKKENVSVNSLINKTLENYAIWNLHNIEFIPVRKALLVKFLDKFTHEEIESVAESMARMNKDTVLRLTSKYDVPAMMNTFDEWLRMTGFPYSYEVDGSVHRFIVLHDLGSKWSLYLTKLASSTLNQFGMIPKYEYTDKILSITIDLAQLDDEKKRTDKQIEMLDAAIKEIEVK